MVSGPAHGGNGGNVSEPDQTEKRGVGRPSIFTADLAIEICARLADGRSIRSVSADEDMPDQRTLFRWLASNETFRQQYETAIAARAAVWGDEITDIADAGSDDVARDKLRVDSRKWLLSKLLPKKYGDRMVHAGDADNPMVIRHEDALAELK